MYNDIITVLIRKEGNMTIKEARLRAIKTDLICAAFRAQDDDYPISYMELELRRIKDKYILGVVAVKHSPEGG